jgi:hypothetical protein
MQQVAVAQSSVVPANWPNTAGASNEVSFAGDKYRVVNALSLDAGASKANAVMQAGGLAQSSLLARDSVVPVSYSPGCQSCGTSGCGGACGDMTYGGFSDYSGYQSYGRAGMACGTPCDPYSYASIEGLYMRRDGDEGFSLSPNFRLNQFGYEWAPRITMGAVPDCSHGYESSFTGILRWDLLASTPVGTNFTTVLTPGLPVPAASLSSFNDATFQSQIYNAEFYSIEGSRTLIGWQVAKVLYGFRYIDYQEDYNYFSTSTATGNSGLLTSNVNNRLFGAQIGLDLLYPVSCFAYAEFRGRAGAFLNFAENDFTIQNNGNFVLANFDEDSEFAGFFELGSGYRYQLGEALTVRGGVEFWYLTGVATAINQVAGVVTPATGARVNADDDIFFLGLSVGAELKF